LKNILRETDSHNANLKRKEEQEARERMRQLHNGRSSRLRLENNRHHGERNAKRRRLEEPKHREVEHERRHPRHRRAGDDENGDEDSLGSQRERRSRRHRRRDVGDESEAESTCKSSRSSRRPENDERGQHSGRHKGLVRSLSERHRPDNTDRRDHRRHRKSRQGSDSKSPSRSPSPKRSRRQKRRDEDEHCKFRSRHTMSKDIPSSPQVNCPEMHKNNDRNLPDDDSVISSPYSDPLSNLVGPLPPSTSDTPPIRSRGRGAYKPTASNIDTHFMSEYDPTLDADLGDNDDTGPTTSKSTRRPVPGLATDEDDWDMALEALRDRAIWRRKGAERLREAGFGENVVDRWVNNGAFAGLDSGGKERDVQDVKWAKKGEGREWDRGKVMDEDGHVDVKASW